MTDRRALSITLRIIGAVIMIVAGLSLLGTTSMIGDELVKAGLSVTPLSIINSNAPIVIGEIIVFFGGLGFIALGFKV